MCCLLVVNLDELLFFLSRIDPSVLYCLLMRVLSCLRILVDVGLIKVRDEVWYKRSIPRSCIFSQQNYMQGISAPSPKKHLGFCTMVTRSQVALDIRSSVRIGIIRGTCMCAALSLASADFFQPWDFLQSTSSGEHPLTYPTKYTNNVVWRHVLPCGRNVGPA